MFDMRMMSTQSKCIHEKELLKQSIQDNKILSDELKIQLNMSDSLKNDLLALKVKFNQLLRDAELTKGRDEMITRRNSCLVKEISDLKKVLMTAKQELLSLKNEYEFRLVSKEKQVTEAKETINMLERSLMQRDVEIAKIHKKNRSIEGDRIKEKDSRKKKDDTLQRLTA